MSATDKQSNQDDCKRQNNTNPLTESQDKQVRKVLWKNGIDTDSNRGAVFCELLLSKTVDSPAGYIVGILKKNPNFGLSDKEISTERAKQPTHIGDILRQMKE